VTLPCSTSTTTPSPSLKVPSKFELRRLCRVTNVASRWGVGGCVRDG
jgi:hypothetical protein